MGELVYGSELSLLYKKEMKEKIDALTYSYNGMALTPELKKEIISFLNKYNAPITAITIILTFEKYVRGEINFSYQM